MIFKIANRSKDTTISSFAKVATGFFSRLLGLMFRKKINIEEALIFYQASSIHTCFMRFPIDIVFLDRQMRAKRLVKNLRPWRLAACKDAYVTIELPAGTISQSNTELGDHIGFFT